MPKRYFSRFVALVPLALLAFSGPAHAQSAFDDPGARTSSGAAGDLRPVNDKTTGSVSLGSSTQVVVLFKNEDSKPIKVSGVSLYPSSNVTATVGENQCSEAPILPGEICASTILVKGLQAGNYRIEMLVRHNGRTKMLTATLDGAVESSGDQQQDIIGDIEVKPADIDFGTLTQSRIQLRPIVMRNVTSTPVTIKDVTINAGENSGFSVIADCGELATGAACIATIKWVPQQAGPSSAMAVINHDGPTRISTVALKGEYNPADSAAAQFFPQAIPGRGLLISSQEKIDFGSSVGQPSSMTVSLVNNGDSPLKINSIRLSGAKSGLDIAPRGCASGTVLEPIEACPLTLTLTPQREGSIFDDVQISHDGARGILVIPVRGSTVQGDGSSGGFGSGGALMTDEQLRNSVMPLSLDDITGDSGSTGGSSVQTKGALTNALNGYKITSFSKDRVILTKDGAGKILYNGRQVLLDGILVNVAIQKNVIEFTYQGERAFLHFDGSFGSLDQSAIVQSAGPRNVSAGSGSSDVRLAPASIEPATVPADSPGSAELLPSGEM